MARDTYAPVPAPEPVPCTHVPLQPRPTTADSWLDPESPDNRRPVPNTVAPEHRTAPLQQHNLYPPRVAAQDGGTQTGELQHVSVQGKRDTAALEVQNLWHEDVMCNVRCSNRHRSGNWSATTSSFRTARVIPRYSAQVMSF